MGDLLIQSGTFSAGRSVVEQGGSCPTGETERREQSSIVLFDPPYREAPQAIVALNGFDFAEGRNARIAVRADDVNRFYMILVVATWCDTILYAARGNFTVIGEVGERF